MNYNTLPEGFSLTRTVDLNTKKMKLWLNLAQLPVLAALMIPAGLAVPLRTQVPFMAFVLIDGAPDRWLGLSMTWLLLMVVGMIGVLLLHELIHGLCFRYIAGGRPKYGHKLPFYLYCACEGRFICKKSYFIVSLAPLAAITALCAALCALVPQAWFWVPYFAFVMNACGCAGDVYISMLLLRMPKDILVVDSGVAMQIYSTQEIAP